VCGEVGVDVRPAFLDADARGFLEYIGGFGQVIPGKEHLPEQRLQIVGEIEHPLQVIGALRTARRRCQRGLVMPFDHQHRQRRRFAVRHAVDHQGRHHAVRIDCQIRRAVLLVDGEIDPFQRVWRADFEQGQMHDQVGRAGSVVERVHVGRPQG